MIDFMVLGLPRSGTAWMANLLTTDNSICLHESFMTYSLNQIDEMEKDDKLLGISETSAIFDCDAINAHKAKKIIIERPLDEINASLMRIGFPMIDETFCKLLKNLEGYRIAFDDLFKHDKVALVYKQLLGKTLDKNRHSLLCSFGVENIYAIHAVRNLLQ